MSYIDTKPRYYGSSFKLSQETGRNLLWEFEDQTNTNQVVQDAYTTLHSFAANCLDNLALLSQNWDQYVDNTNPNVIEYKKESMHTTKCIFHRLFRQIIFGFKKKPWKKTNRCRL